MGSKFLTSAVLTAAIAGLPVSAGIEDKAHFNVMGAVVVWGSDATSGVPVISDFIIDTGNGATAAASGDADLIAGNAHTVVTGTLLATKDAVNSVGTMPFLITNTASGTINTDSNGDGILNGSDAVSSFGLNPGSDTRIDATTTRSSFYVASNTAFAIDVQAQPPATGLDVTLLNIIRLNMKSTVSGDDGLAFGSRAQAAHTGGPTAGFAGEYRLIQTLPGRRVFTGNRRTAASAGTLAEQSIRFDAEYSIRAVNLTGYDLSLGTFDFNVDVVYTVFVP